MYYFNFFNYIKFIPKKPAQPFNPLPGNLTNKRPLFEHT